MELATCRLDAAPHCLRNTRDSLGFSVSSGTASEGPAPVRLLATELGYRVACYAVAIESIPADFFADPDGQWTFETLAAAAGFSARDGVAIGALRLPFNGHPDGAAVVTLNAEARPYIAIIECPIAFVCTTGEQRVSAA
jgi:hypothetical protein